MFLVIRNSSDFLFVHLILSLYLDRRGVGVIVAGLLVAHLLLESLFRPVSFHL